MASIDPAALLDELKDACVCEQSCLFSGIEVLAQGFRDMQESERI